MIATETRMADQMTPNAASSPTCAFSHSSKIATDTTGVCGLTSKTDMESSLAERRKINTQPPKNDGVIKGKTMRRIDLDHEAPETYEASSSSLCNCKSPECV